MLKGVFGTRWVVGHGHRVGWGIGLSAATDHRATTRVAPTNGKVSVVVLIVRAGFFANVFKGHIVYENFSAEKLC